MDPDDAELAQVTDDELRAAASAVGAGAVGYRGQRKAHLNEKDLDEVERFTTVAAFLVVVAGLPVLRAWSAANEWITEHGAELPGGLGPMLVQHRGAEEACRAHNPEVPRSNRGGATETARADAAPERSEVLPGPAPSLRAASAPVVDRDVRPQKVEVLCAGCTHPEEWHTTGVCYHCGCERFRRRTTAAERRAEREEHAAKPCPALSPRANRPCGKPGVWGGFCVVHGQRRERGIEVRVATTAARVHQEDGNMWKEEVFEALQKAGNATGAELAEKMGEDRVRVNGALKALLADKRVDRHGGWHGAHWEVGTGKSTTDEGGAGGPRREPAPRAAPRDAKGGGVKNGKASNGHAKKAKRERAGAWEIVIPAAPEDLVESPLLEQLLETRAGLIEHVEKTVEKIDKLDQLLGTFSEPA